MWIRSQDKERLIDLRVFEVDKECNSYVIKGYSDDWANINNFHIVLGWYSTKEKALTVLDMLQKRLCVIEEWKLSKTLMQWVPQNRLCIDTNGFVFIMPTDDEV